MANLGKVVYLTSAQYNTLYSNGTITVDGVTITYSANDVYMVQDSGSSSVPATTTPNQVLISTSGSGVLNWRYVHNHQGDIETGVTYTTPSDVMQEVGYYYQDDTARYYFEPNSNIVLHPGNDADNGTLTLIGGRRYYMEKVPSSGIENFRFNTIIQQDGVTWLLEVILGNSSENYVLIVDAYLLSTWGIGANEYMPAGNYHEDIEFTLGTGSYAGAGDYAGKFGATLLFNTFSVDPQ